MYVITGVSSGIGKALADYFLEKGEKVIGLSRTNEIEHENYTFLPTDLSSFDDLKKLDLSKLIGKEEDVVLINNAGTIGKIKRARHLNLEDYLVVSNLNVVAVQYLCSHLLKLTGSNKLKAIVNISSGAARRPIASWSAYCASKAAVDSFSEVLKEEFLEEGIATKVFSVAPGIVDTQMQTEIRSSNSEDFSAHSKFVDLKKTDSLRPPEEVAKAVDKLLEVENGDVVCRLE